MPPVTAGEGPVKTENFDREFFTQILEKNGTRPEDVESLDAVIPPLHGDHFASSVFTVTATLKSGEKIELFIKKTVDNPTYSKQIEELQLFEREAVALTEIIPFMKKFAQRRAAPSGKSYDYYMVPKCYFANKKFTVLENIVFQNYANQDKFEKQDLRMASVTLKALAKYHAPSYVLLKEELTREDLVKLFPILKDDAFTCESGKESIKAVFDKVTSNVRLILEVNPNDEHEYGNRFLDSLDDDIPGYLIRKNDEAFDPKFVCLCHGDLWNNNIMFRQTEPESQLEVKLVDYQCPRIMSMCQDISNYVYGSIKPHVRKEHWKDILKIYYDSFKENVEILGSHVDFTFPEFVDNYKRNLHHGFIIGLLMVTLQSNFEAKADLDKSEGSFADNLAGNIKHWLEDNPERAKDMRKEIIHMFEEHKDIYESE